MFFVKEKHIYYFYGHDNKCVLLLRYRGWINLADLLIQEILFDKILIK